MVADGGAVVTAQGQRPCSSAGAAHPHNAPAALLPPLYSYEQGANISEVGTLVQCAVELGLPADELRAHLEQDRGRDEVLRQDARAKREMQITGVPYYVIGEGNSDGGTRVALSGAQPARALVQAAHKVLAAQAAGA